MIFVFDGYDKMDDSQWIFGFMALFNLLLSVIILFVTVDENSWKTIAFMGSGAKFWKYKWSKYVFSGFFLIMSVFSFAVFRGWVK